MKRLESASKTLAYFQSPIPCKRHAKARRACWKYTVEHVETERRAHDQVGKITYAHTVTRSILWQQLGTTTVIFSLFEAQKKVYSFIVRQKASFSSPPDRPPTANPGAGLFNISSMQMRLSRA